MISDRLIDSVKHHEGYRSKAYQDSVGVWTVGYGQNLQVLEIDEELAESWLMRELHELEAKLSESVDFRGLDEVRQAVLIEMAYNLGLRGLMGFKNMLAAVDRKDWDDAAAHGLDSKWSEQVGKRADTLMVRLATGEW